MGCRGVYLEDNRDTRPEDSYRLWCVFVCDLETSWMRRPWPTGGCWAKRERERIITNRSHLQFTLTWD